MASIQRNMTFLRRLSTFSRKSVALTQSQDEMIIITKRCCGTNTTDEDNSKAQDNTSPGSNTTDNEKSKAKDSNKLSRDPFILFMRTDVQSILTKLRGFDPQKIFQSYKAQRTTKPRYKVMTDEEMKKEFDTMLDKRAWMRLQMPPFMEERRKREEILSDDRDIAPTISKKIVFVDVSWKNKRIMGNYTRPVVCRNTDGTLTYADWDTVDRVCQIFNPVEGREMVMPKMFEEKQLEKYADWDMVDRVCQIFNPVEGREMVIPKMFEQKQLKEILGRKDVEYRYILERACVQFEPDSEHFIRVSRRVYEEIAKRKAFCELSSTRFYGPMVFYFCWVKYINPLLQFYIEEEKNVVNGALLVVLYSTVNPEFKLNKRSKAITIVQQYVDYAKARRMEGWEKLQEALHKAQPQKLKGNV